MRKERGEKKNTGGGVLRATGQRTSVYTVQYNDDTLHQGLHYVQQGPIFRTHNKHVL